MKCINCNQEITTGRIKALPKTKTCVECSSENKKKAFKVISGKTTYSELDIVDEQIYKILSNWDRSHWRAVQ